MKKYSFVFLITLLVIGCSEFNAVKAPSVEITKSDNTADYCTIVLTAGRYGIIKYTTDGTAPIASSATYSEAISLPVGTTRRTASFCPGGRRSEIITTTIETPSAASYSITSGEYCTPSDSE